MILQKIVEDYSPKAEGLTITDIRIGLEYVGIELSNGNIGVSYLFKEDVGGCHHRKNAGGGFIGESAQNAIAWSLDMKDILLSSIGIATINALTVPEEAPQKNDKDGVEYMGITKNDVVGMVGYFRPMVPALKKQCKELKIFERRLAGNEPDVYPDWAAYSLLPSCDIVIVSGTTQINKTQDVVLSYCTGAREVAVLGPSTIMYPDAYAGTRATLIAGAYADPSLKKEIFTVVAQGGGGFHLLQFLRKYSIRLS